ncbi:MAG: RibD family protein [Dehalococcoidia bacterium]
MEADDIAAAVAYKPDYTSLTFGEPPAGRPYVIVNMVSSLDGRVTIEGNERGLGSKIDQRLMRELRVHADIVMNGAGTLRASGTSSRLDDPALEELRIARGKTRTPISAIVSASGDLPLERAFFRARDFEGVVYLAASAPAERREAIEATGRRVFEVPDEGVRWILHHMRDEFDAGLLLVEGGPTLNGELFDAGLVDELFLTLGPVVVGGNDVLAAVVSDRAPSLERTTRLEIVSAVPNPVTNEIYTRYQVQRET